MATKKTGITADATTEERIKEAARAVFVRKGFAASRTRDIAEEAGLNIALLHYYFRSKEKLFEIVMLETLQQFAAGMLDMLNDKKTSLEEKLSALAGRYIDLLTLQPELPLFVMTEIRNDAGQLVSKLGIREALVASVFMKQLKTLSAKRRIDPIQLFLSIMGMTIFPFIGKPMVQSIWQISNEQFSGLMKERKKLIPVWIRGMLDGD